jgi:hypothetical protein
MLRKLWLWFSIWHGWSVHGERSGEKYKDPRTGRLLGTRIDDPLLQISGVRWGQTSLDDSTAPLAVYLTPGAFLERFRQSPQVLQHFGRLRILSEIPSGKPSGEWAKCVGAALQQLWRQWAKRAKIGSVGEDNRPTVLGLTFTRRLLFDVFPPTRHPVQRILSDPKAAARARRYWDAAMRELRRRGVVGHWKSKGTLPRERGRDGRLRMCDGWQEAWLDEPLDIRPGALGTRAMARIRKSVVCAAGARRRRGKLTAGAQP